MPIHDWTRVDAGTYHGFHFFWTKELCDALNRGVLPEGFFALPEQRVEGPEGDVVTAQLRGAPAGGGVAIAEAPPSVWRAVRPTTEAAAYARLANRVAVREADEGDRVVAVIELVSPGNKDSRHAAQAFTSKVVGLLRRGVHCLVVDPFPPTPRDPGGLHLKIWQGLGADGLDALPADRPLSVSGFEAEPDLAAYIDAAVVGGPWPDGTLFLGPGRYVPAPLERSYQASWEALPLAVRRRVEPPA